MNENALSIEEFGLPTPEPLAAARLERPVLVRLEAAGGEGRVHVGGGGGGGEGEGLGWGGGAAAAAAARGPRRRRLLGAGAGAATSWCWRWRWRRCPAWSGGFGGCGSAGRGGFGAFGGGLAGVGVGVGVVVVAGADGDRGGGGGGGGGGGCCSQGRGGRRGQADGSVGQGEDLRVVGGLEELLWAPVHILVIRQRSCGGRRRRFGRRWGGGISRPQRRPALNEDLEFFSLEARAP